MLHFARGGFPGSSSIELPELATGGSADPKNLFHPRGLEGAVTLLFSISGAPELECVSSAVDIAMRRDVAGSVGFPRERSRPRRRRGAMNGFLG
jgi:hypothetical protein